jgi:hypothetical protein
MAQHLRCACCGESAYGKQWWNRDTGWGLCVQCGEEMLSGVIGGTPMPIEELERSYGRRGVHWDVKTQKQIEAEEQAEKFAGSGI